MHARPLAQDRRPSATTPFTGDQWVIGHGHQRAVVTEVGATLRSFTVDDAPVIEGFSPQEMCRGGRGQVLAPWPNRLGDGRYAFGDVEAVVPMNEPTRRTAIHGLVRWLPWRMESRAQNRVTLSCHLFPSPAYPFALALTIEYRLGRDGLTVETRAEQLGGPALPFGIGFHPYLTLGTATIDELVLTLPAERALTCDDRGLPTGSATVADTPRDFRQGRPLGSLVLDTAFTGLAADEEGRTSVELDRADGSRGTTLWVDENFTHLMVFTGDTLGPDRRRTGLAVEPMTCPPDAFRSETDLVVLDEGGSWTGSWGITPR